jgi:uncharacterized cofD-like protein
VRKAKSPDHSSHELPDNLFPKSSHGPSQVANLNEPGRIVAIGGGTGLSTLLRGLKEFAPRFGQPDAARPIADLAAVVTVMDDGGSSGRLRREYSILPPGDIRNCLVALSDDEALLNKLFRYRFAEGRGLRGHSLGNLFLTALTNITGDFAEAVRESGRVLAIRGRIYPSTLQNVTLEATMENGRVVAGETRIPRAGGRIRELRLRPRRVRPLAEAMRAIENADVILVGPGSLYTSVIPNLLVTGVAEAIERSRAARVFISNLMTQPGETDGMSTADHVRAIYQHTGCKLFDWVVISQANISPRVAKRYRAEGAEPVINDMRDLAQLGLRCISGELLEESGVIRHDPARLAGLLVKTFLMRDGAH